MKILKVSYNIIKEETTIFYKIFKFGKEREEFKTFEGKIDKKRENPTISEVLKFIDIERRLKE